MDYVYVVMNVDYIWKIFSSFQKAKDAINELINQEKIGSEIDCKIHEFRKKYNHTKPLYPYDNHTEENIKKFNDDLEKYFLLEKEVEEGEKQIIGDNAEIYDKFCEENNDDPRALRIYKYSVK